MTKDDAERAEGAMTPRNGLDPDIWGPAPSRMKRLRSATLNRARLAREAMHHGALHVPTAQHHPECALWWGQGTRCDCSRPRRCDTCGRRLRERR